MQQDDRSSSAKVIQKCPSCQTDFDTVLPIKKEVRYIRQVFRSKG